MLATLSGLQKTWNEIEITTHTKKNFVSYLGSVQLHSIGLSHKFCFIHGYQLKKINYNFKVRNPILVISDKNM